MGAVQVLTILFLQNRQTLTNIEGAYNFVSFDGTECVVDFFKFVYFFVFFSVIRTSEKPSVVHEKNRHDMTRNRHEKSAQEKHYATTNNRRRDENEHDKNLGFVVSRRVSQEKDHSRHSHYGTRYKTKIASNNEILPTNRNKDSYEERRNSRVFLNQTGTKREIENKSSLEKRYDKDSPTNRVENDSSIPSTNFTRPKKHYRGERR